MTRLPTRVPWAVLGIAVACSRPPAEPPSTPVILISLDTLRADHLGAYGYARRPTSPHLDALAKDAVVFEQHQSAAPWTTPAHLSMMSGLYPAHHGVFQPYFSLISGLESGGQVDALASARVTLAEALAADGYRTAAFTGGGAVDPAVGLGQGFERYDTHHYKLTDAHLSELDAWLDAAGDAPFFLFWHTFEVHAPYTDTRFVTADLAPAPEALAGLTESLRDLDTLLRKGRPGERQQAKAHTAMRSILQHHGMATPKVTEALYDGGIAAADQRVGELVASLKRRGLYDRALLIVTSDHGDEFTEHNPFFYDAHGHSLYEELIHTPLIVKLPGNSSGGQRVSQRVSAVDLLPTITELVGAEEPKGLDGRSLVPLLAGGSLPEVPVYSEALNAKEEKKAVTFQGRKAIATIDASTVTERGRMHLPDTPAVELYALGADPAERSDLSRSEDHTDLLDRLRTHVAAGGRTQARADLDAQTVEQLEAMGYLEPGAVTSSPPGKAPEQRDPP